MHHIFSEISILIVFSAVIALMMKALRQPLLIGYILTGIIVGPTILNIGGSSPEVIRVMGEFGIALLLFIVGLGLNPKEIKDVGRVALLTGVGQVLFTSGIGYLIVRALGYSPMASFYIAVALTFSSTIIILKLLTDKREHNQLFGKISIGFLLVQDIIAAIALVVASATGQGGLSVIDLYMLVVKGLIILVSVVVLANTVVKYMTNFLSSSQELLFLFALAWGFGVGAISLESGFSLEVGALLAGIALAPMPYAQEVSSRLRPLRDFFIVVFFIALGSNLNFGNIGPIIPQAIGLSLFVLIGNPIIVMIIMGLLGYTKRTGFKAGLTVAQISEFSIIFVLLGQRNGQLDNSVVSLVTVVGMITIAISSYMIIYSESLYERFEKYLGIFERQKTKSDGRRNLSYDAILFGYRRGGFEYVRVFRRIVNKYVVIDYDPEAIEEMEHKKIPYLYGDATDVQLLEEAGIEKTKIIVSNVSDHDTNLGLLQTVNRINPKAVVICRSDSVEDANRLYEHGANYVLLPHFIGNERISSFIKKSGLKKSEFNKYRKQHIEYLNTHVHVPEKSDDD